MSTIGAGARGLILDDNEASRFLVGSWLRQAGFDVREASTGAQALEVLQQDTIDLAVLDVNLPDISGYEVCEAIRANPSTTWMPVIHVSATAIQAADRSEGLLRGADAFLVHPIERSDFVGVVTALSRRSSGRRTVTTTAVRLRELASSTADVHGASEEGTLFRAMVTGASRIAATPATLVMRTSRGCIAVTGQSASRTITGDVLAELLLPAQAGVTTLVTDDRAVVDHPHIGVPFVDETGEPLGAILAPADVEQAEEVLSLFAHLGIATSLALANIRALSAEHRIALVLQRSLLPERPPDIPSLQIAFKYIAASPQAQVGGDFYEAFALDEHIVVLAIGDVVGHSLRAATVMGEIRYALRAYAIDDSDPRSVVGRLERLVRRFHPDMFASMIYATIDTSSGELRMCNAGHLPAVIIHDGVARLEESHGTVIGIGAPAPPMTTTRLTPGDRLVLVTDGLIERRRQNLDISLERLRHGIEELHAQPVATMVDQLLTIVGPGDSPEDDIAILAAEFD